jgi:hypothetical protein
VVVVALAGASGGFDTFGGRGAAGASGGFGGAAAGGGRGGGISLKDAYDNAYYVKRGDPIPQN